MREIKFRAWDNGKRKFLSDDYGPISVGDSKVVTGGDWQGVYYTDEYTIEQYTGLKDKNGKEIYEGDILREKWHDSDINMGRDRIGKVEYFCDGYICWFRGSAFVGLGMFPTKNIEIIGNIHENPELLGDKDGKAN